MKNSDNRMHLRFIGRMYTGEQLVGYHAVILEKEEYVKFETAELEKYNKKYIFENVIYLPKTNSVRVKAGIKLRHIQLKVTAQSSAKREKSQAIHYGIAVSAEPRRVDLKKRNVYTDLVAYLNDTETYKLAALAGLRRTGKTVLLNQLLQYCVQQGIAARIITLANGFDVKMADVYTVLDDLVAQGIKNVFIDEITFAADFQTCCTRLADYYVGQLGMHIVIAGTASLGIYMPTKDLLYDRVLLLNTAYVPFAEWRRLRPDATIKQYLQRASNLSADADYASYAVTHDYIETSIIQNIMTSIEHAKYQWQYRALLNVYNTGALPTIITRLIEGYSIALTEELINAYFTSNMLGSVTQLYNARCSRLDEEPLDSTVIADILSDFAYRLSLQLKPIEHVTDEHLQTVKQFLSSIGIMNELLPKSPLFRESTICIQYGLVYSCALHLMQSIREQLTIEALTKQQVDTLIQLVMQDVQGQLMAQMIQYETALTNDGKVDKFSAKDAGEIDMIVWHDDNTCDLYEIKRSDKCVENQTRWLRNEKVLMQVQQKYGKIRTRNVLYNGTTTFVTHDGVQISYINATDYLLGLK